MKWIVFVAIAAGILAIFGLVYGISFLVERSRRSKAKSKSTAPDDDPKFLRDLAERLKQQEEKDKDKDDEGKTGEQ
ncbi:hypothetical protein [Rhodoluna sp.]|uniref:hypothetical protein n=1 Tax=Rhodoluna sp. TaxID=1969481 RepID=UPI0025F37696|nr:hypothetical protein [Rhodoluna sp.]